jgi:hypothetical protein
MQRQLMVLNTAALLVVLAIELNTNLDEYVQIETGTNSWVRQRLQDTRACGRFYDRLGLRCRKGHAFVRVFPGLDATIPFKKP